MGPDLGGILQPALYQSPTMQTPDWWRGATFYQIYPRSFLDSDGDGVGDLRGITAKLDHVASMGVDGVWISPFFPSPMRDFGYDVSDYCNVDPLFGTLSDVDALLARAHALGLRVLIDQVWSHTAIEHPWFEQSRQSRDNDRADWYVWADPRPDGTPPNNWQSWMGGGTWSWEPRRQQYYLHNFLPEMPDLNLHSKAVQDAILEIGRFWLARGVDGFRLDTANYYCHDLQLRDNPPQAPGGRGEVPAAMQQHLYNICQPQTLPFLARVRALTNAFDGRMTVAEIGSADNQTRMIEYTRGREHLHTAYSFMLLGQRPTPVALAEMMAAWQQGDGAQAWPSWALSNHDAPRVATRWADGDPSRVPQLLMLLMSLRGSLFLYQGEELGLTQSELRQDQLRDPYGLANWPRHAGRDGCRTPMPWNSELPQAGFSSSAAPWLPLDPAHRALAVDRQQADPGSALHLTRRLLRWRRRHPALRLGDFSTLQADDSLWLAQRRHGDDALVLAFNFGEGQRCVDLPKALTSGATETLSVQGACLDGTTLQLPPWSALWLPVGNR